MKVLIFDTETTGITVRRADHTHPGQPEPAQLAAILCDEEKVYASINLIIQTTIPIPEVAANIHGITDQIAADYGVTRRQALSAFNALAKQADQLVCHNYGFDSIVVKAMYHREQLTVPTFDANCCTMLASMNICKLPSPWKGNEYKWPKLEEAYKILIDPAGFEGAHDAMNDVNATYAVWKKLRELGAI